jgi:hypothetical protein|tara:strand:+ start:815 stop:1009 length:195 start_codon:yes stop_codon:yes gene_type:complete
MNDVLNDELPEDKWIRVVCEDFWEDGELDEYYEQLGKEIFQREYLKCGPYWDKINELNEKSPSH